MPRRLRVDPGGVIYHVMNRVAGRGKLFRKEADYVEFEQILAEAHERIPVRILAYCLMPDHWHLILWPEKKGQLSDFLRLVSVTHVQRHHARYHLVGTGALYRGRYKSFPVQDERCASACRYVERNPVRAKLARRAEQWAWSSAAIRPIAEAREWLLSPKQWPVRRRPDWGAWVNLPQPAVEEEALRDGTRRGRPFGDDEWTRSTARRLLLESSLRPRGRPRKVVAKGAISPAKKPG